MKRLWVPVMILTSLSGCVEPVRQEPPAIIPQPVSVTMLKGSFSPANGYRVESLIVDRSDEYLPGEYRLRIGRKVIRVESGDSAGLFYGLQTLRQIGPFDEEGRFTGGPGSVVPRLEINDYPRYQWRGLMLDCSRTFLPVSYLKKTIDRMALLKMNVLHLHLTDDQGWRIEIPKYPDLVNVSSQFSANYPGETGGYYSIAELRDLVTYASQRQVTIVPEIEMPGHSSEVFAAYPELSCRGRKTEIFPFFSGPGITEDILCAGNDHVFTFLRDVIDVVVSVFPSEYIHVGGDEAPKARWKECPRCQERMRSLNLKNEEELQSYFVGRMAEYIQSLGRTAIGWDEILEGGLPAGTAVMSWRGVQGGLEAVRLGHRVVMSPTSHCYFDYDHKTTPLEKVYAFEPTPEALDSVSADLILGGQANFWSHIDRTEPRIDDQLYPRLFAMAEALWSAPASKDFNGFVERLTRDSVRWNRLGWNPFLPANLQ